MIPWGKIIRIIETLDLLNYKHAKNEFDSWIGYCINISLRKQYKLHS